MANETGPSGRVLPRLGLSLAVMLAVAVSAPLIGSTPVSFSRAWAGQAPDADILFQARVPRVLLALLAGGALSVAGVLFQALLREPLATPEILGVSGGASLGAVAAISGGWQWAAGLPALWLSAFLGALAVLGIVLALASESSRLSTWSLLLAGVTLNSVCLALILFLQSVANFNQSFAMSRWLMGGLESAEYSSLAWLAVLLLPVCGLICGQARAWNLIAVSEEWAATRGVSTRRLMLSGYLTGSVLTGLITALTGPIGFLGLIVPHALRLRWGADHRLLLPCSFLWGAAFLTACDTVARTALAPAEVPVGVVTALVGGPFFLWLLRSRRSQLWQ